MAQSLTPTPEEFLRAFYGDRWQEVWVTSFPDFGPKGVWFGGRYRDGVFQPDHNNFFCIGLLEAAATQRSVHQVAAEFVIVADDIGTKVKIEDWETMFALGFPRPTVMIETSPKNWTYQWAVDRSGVEDEKCLSAELAVIRSAMVERVLTDDVMDTVRYIRCPWGVNSKPKYLEEFGLAPPVRLTEWNPESKLNVDQAGTLLLGPDWRDEIGKPSRKGIASHQSAMGALRRTADINRPSPYILMAHEIGMNPEPGASGAVNALCPNHLRHGVHTSNEDTGFAFLGSDLMECHHAHCRDLRTPDFQRIMREIYTEQQEYKEAVGALAEGEPTSAEAFLVAACGGLAEPDQVAEEAEAMAENMAGKEERTRIEFDGLLAQMDSRYCLVEGIRGVVDRRPAEEDETQLFNVIPRDHFLAFHNGRGKTKRGKTEIGLATWWIDRPETPRFSTIGMWLPGREPKVGPGGYPAINLWTGFPDTTSDTHEFPRVKPGSVKDCDEIVKFIRDVIADGRQHVADWVLDWLAFKVQNPLTKPGTNLFLVGGQGTGKSTLALMIADLFGPKFAVRVDDSHQLLGQFNGHLEGKLLLVAEEALFGRDPKVAGKFKSLTTDSTMRIERKGVDMRAVKNMLAMVITSNSWTGVPIEPNDRRTTCIAVPDVKKNDTAYFALLRANWGNGGREAFLDMLLRRNLPHFDPRLPLRTPEKALAAGETADPVTRWWGEVLTAGNVPGAADILSADNSTPDWDGGSVVIRNAAIVEDFKQWARQSGVRHLPSNEVIHSRIRELCPKVGPRKRKRFGGNPEAYREFPARQECLDLYAEAMGSDGSENRQDSED